MLGLPPTPEEVQAFVADDHQMPTSSSLSEFWRILTMASGGLATGWIWSALPKPTASKPIVNVLTHGHIATM